MTGENANSKETEVRRGLGHGKRESCSGTGVVGVDRTWRCPKRMRGSAWSGGEKEDGSISNSKFLALQSSLQDVCSFDDLHQRMKLYLSLCSCKEIFSVMTQVAKVRVWIYDSRSSFRFHVVVLYFCIMRVSYHAM